MLTLEATKHDNFTRTGKSTSTKRNSRHLTSARKRRIDVDPEWFTISWCDKYTPSATQDVPVSSKKKTEIANWLERALTAHNEYPDTAPHVLALCGVSGGCKSTLMSLIAREAGVEIMEWSEAAVESDSLLSATASSSSTLSAGDINLSVDSGTKKPFYRDTLGRSGYSRTAQDLFHVNGVTQGSFGTSKTAALEDLALRSQYPGLILSSSSASSSTEGGTAAYRESVNSSNRSSKSQGSTRKSTSIGLDRSNSSTNSCVSVSVSGDAKITQHSSDVRRTCNTLIVMQDLPMNYLSTVSNSKSRSSIKDNSDEAGSHIYQFLLTFRCPIVIILSDVGGYDDQHYVIERCLPASVKNRLIFEAMYIPPITVQNISKILRNIATQEGPSTANEANATMIADIASTCLGDLRHAILQLQFSMARQQRKSISKASLEQELLVVAPTDPSSAEVASASASMFSTQSTFERSQSQADTTSSPSKSTNSNRKLNTNRQTVDLTVDSDSSPAVHKQRLSRKKGMKAVGEHKNKRQRRSIRVILDEDSSSSHGEDEDEDDDGGGVDKADKNDGDDNDGGVDNNQRSTTTTAAIASNPHANEIGTKERGNNISRASLSEPTSAPPLLYTDRAYMSQSQYQPFGRRDEAISSLYSVGKILNAKLNENGVCTKYGADLDGIIERSELDVEMMYLFLQSNAIKALEATPRVLSTSTAVAGTGGSSSSNSSSGGAPVASEEFLTAAIAEDGLKQMDEIDKILSLYSEVDVHLSTKYNPSLSMDRAESTSYPLSYATAILSRSGAVCRGSGSEEQYARAKKKGISTHMACMYRPRYIDLRRGRIRNASKIDAIQNELLLLGSRSKGSSSGPDMSQLTGHSAALGPILSGVPTTTSTKPAIGLPVLCSQKDLALLTIPYHRAIYSIAQRFMHYHISTQQQQQQYNNANGISPQLLPLYSDRVDQMMQTVYSNSMMGSQIQYQQISPRGVNSTTVTNISTIDEHDGDDIIDDSSDYM